VVSSVLESTTSSRYTDTGFIYFSVQVPVGVPALEHLYDISPISWMTSQATRTHPPIRTDSGWLVWFFVTKNKQLISSGSSQETFLPVFKFSCHPSEGGREGLSEWRVKWFY